MKTIRFVASTKEAELASVAPEPASKFVPEWYKKIGPWTNGAKKLSYPFGSETHNASIKRCVPFLDAMTAGYIFSLDDDIYVELDANKQPFIRWKSTVDMVTWHSIEQWEGFPLSEEYHQMIAKWHNEWQIITPKGYSLWVTHPTNRYDLPFHTLTGFVDTDGYDMRVQFPFILKKNFEGIIPAGTPLAQLIPVKRDDFTGVKEKYDADQQYVNRRNFWRTFAGTYKTNYWKKKKYQ